MQYSTQKRKFYSFNTWSMLFHFNQGSAKKGPWAKSSSCVFVNKGLLENNHACLFMAAFVERKYDTKYLLSDTSQTKFAEP